MFTHYSEHTVTCQGSFLKETGSTIQDSISQVRVDRASNLLLCSDLSLSAIAGAWGIGLIPISVALGDDRSIPLHRFLPSRTYQRSMAFPV